MVIARFHFKPEAANQFCWHATQEIVEMQFQDTVDVVSFCKEFEDALIDCTVIVGDQLLQLSGFSS